MKHGSIKRFWNDSFKNLSYIRQPITLEEVCEWEAKGYDSIKSFTGMMYDNKNPMPDWVSQLDDQFGFRNQTYTFYRMSTLEIMPAHSDHYRTYAKINGIEPDLVSRAIMFLEDWKPGHYLEVEGHGIVNWKAGDWYSWDGFAEHAAANIGIDDRYTLQITGIPTMALNR